MIELERVTVGRAPATLSDVSLSWRAGVHAVVGAPRDGGARLLAVMAGIARPRAGHVRVLGEPPTGIRVRPQIAWVPLAPALPEAMRVREVLDLAARVRGEPVSDAATRLDVLGVGTLAARPTRTLKQGEARAVALAEALTSTRVRVLLVEEPLVDLDPRAASRIGEALRKRARQGTAIVVATSSARDALALADDHALLRGGRVFSTGASLDADAGLVPAVVRVRIVCSDPIALTGALARQPDIEAVGRGKTAVVARGRDLASLAQAASRAILEAGVELSELRVEPASLDDARTPMPEVPR